MPNNADRDRVRDHVPWELSGDPTASLMVTCEHASNAVPAELNQLGLSDAQLLTHIAIDIGAAQLAAALRDRLNACLIRARYSRLLVDLNRYSDDPSVVLEVSDEVVVPSNAGLDQAEISQRIQRYHTPYHTALSEKLDDLQAHNKKVDMLFVHSFTPQMGGVTRPWHVGLLFHDDGANARAMATALERETDYVVGMNEPYSAVEPRSYALFEHAVKRDLGYLVIEVRQDLLASSVMVAQVAQKLAPALSTVFQRQNFGSTDT